MTNKPIKKHKKMPKQQTLAINNWVGLSFAVYN